VALLNYTTEIDAAKTAGQVQTLLAKAGARAVAMEFDDGEPVAIAFTAATAFGPREFTLPIHADKVLAVLRRDRVQARYQTGEQARRVAWRIVKDWVEAQLAIIRTEMVTLDQVMLPYMRNGDGTVYEQFAETQRLAIEGP
jgi:hypothetical protein